MVSGCTGSSTKPKTVVDDDYKEIPTTSTIDDDSYTKPSTTSEPLIDATYRKNADKAAWDAIDYCKRNPYGTFRTTVYNGQGVGVPITIQC